MNRLYCRAVKVIEATFGLISNNEELVCSPEFFDFETQRRAPKPWSLMTSIHRTDSIEFTPTGLDTYVHLLDIPDARPETTATEHSLFSTGDFTDLERTAENKRLAYFGNMGQFFAYSMYALEKWHDIFSFHGAVLYRPESNELILILGGSGSGKSIYLMEGLLRRGCQLFSAEMAHFRLTGDGIRFFKGALFDNVRIGNLRYDFPEAIDEFRGELPEVQDIWRTTVALNLERFATQFDVVDNPSVVVLFPRIEANREDVFVDRIISEGKLRKMLYDNAAEKVGKSYQLYNGNMPVFSLDSQALARKRLEAVEQFMVYSGFRESMTVLAGIKDCWAWAG